MKLSDLEILDVYNVVKAEGHPDPVGFIARSDLASGLDNDYSNKDRVGITGLKPSQAEKIEAGDVQDIVQNLSAAVKLDIDNYSEYKDVSNMHVAFESGGEAVADRSKRPKKFLRDLSKAKVKWDKRIKEIKDNQQPIEVPQVEAQVPQIAAAPRGENTSFGGDASKLEQIRKAFVEPVKQKREIPKSVTNKTKSELRKLIKRAVLNA